VGRADQKSRDRVLISDRLAHLIAQAQTLRAYTALLTEEIAELAIVAHMAEIRARSLLGRGRVNDPPIRFRSADPPATDEAKTVHR
jgi:hypothetical protein